MERPIIGIPLGDPAGIGPEITVKTFTFSFEFVISIARYA